MQDNPTAAKNRVLQERYKDGDPRRISGKQCEELIRNAMSLFPGLPAANLVPEINAIADPEFLAALDRDLRTKYWIRTINELRRSDRRGQSAQGWILPEIQKLVLKLPQNVPIGEGKAVERDKANYEDLENYLKVLNKQDPQRHKRRIAAVRKLMLHWSARTKKT